MTELDNYQNEELRLTHRTNNWGSISSDGWEGELDINYQKDSRKIAIFGHPKDSIRAISKLFLIRPFGFTTFLIRPFDFTIFLIRPFGFKTCKELYS